MSDEEKYCRVVLKLRLDGNKVVNGIIVLTRLDSSTVTTGEEVIGENIPISEYKLITNNEGVARVSVPYGEYLIHAEYTDIEHYNYDSPTFIQLKDEEEYMSVDLYRCNNEILLDKSCKYFLHEPYMTPNNYDLYFNYAKIPVNNIVEPPRDLRKRLQRTLPLTKILHLNLETTEEPEYNTVHIHSKCKLTYECVNDELVTYLIKGVWNEDYLNGLLMADAQEDYDEYLDGLEEGVTPTDTLEDYINALNIDDYKSPITVYMVRVGSEEVNPKTFNLNNDNNYTAYSEPLPKLDNGKVVEYALRYSVVSGCTITFNLTSSDAIIKTVEVV